MGGSFNPLSAILKENKLTGPNYIDWKRILNLVLTTEGYKFVLTEKCPHSFLPASTILIPKYFFEVQHHVIGSNHGLMLMLQHIGHRGQYVAASHLISLSPFLIGLVFLFRGDAIWLIWAYLSQYKFIALGSQDKV